VKTVHFDLKDVDGVSHTYNVELFSVAQNAKLQLMCARPLLKAVGKLASVIAPAFRDLKDAGIENVNALQIFTAVDWGEATDALLAIPEMLEGRGGAALVTEIFERTERMIPIPALQGLPTATDQSIPTAHPQALKSAQEQDAAFGDGNMAEYWQAAAMVLVVNFTRYGRHGSKGLSELVKKLTLGAVDLSQLST
jgi:hypothetical protein